MANYHPWKAFERRCAKALRGVRLWRPDFGDSIPDGESDTHCWDAKVRKSIAVVGWFLENEKKYREYTAGRRFVLPLFSREHQGDFVLVRLSDYASDQEELQRLREEEGNERA